MTTKRKIACFCVCQALALFSFAISADAQTRVSIVDIGEVFKNHPSFSQHLAELKTEAEQFKAASMQLRQQLMKKAEVLRQYEPGSTEFKTAEAELAKESAAMEVEQRNQMRELMKQEAKLHFDTYEQVQKAISDYCEPLNIQLVLRHNSVEMQKGNPSSIMQRVNGAIVFHQPNQDITAAVIAQLPTTTR